MRAELDSYREAFLQALLEGDARAAEIATSEAIDAGLDELCISEQVISSALHTVCEMWEAGLIGGEDEEEAARISVRVLALQREVFRRALERGGETIVLAELEGEFKTTQLAAAAQAVARAGFAVNCIGHGVPVLSVAGAVSQQRPQGVVLHVDTPDSGRLLEYAIEEVEMAAPKTPVLVGGPGVPAELCETETMRVWESPREIVAKLDALVIRPWLN
jgi:methanogenic corrinoid protein MtbC1